MPLQPSIWRGRPRAVFAAFAVGCLAVAASAQPAAARAASFDDPTLATAAQGVPMGGSLEVRDVELFPGQEASRLLLERFAVFSRGARVHVDDGVGVLSRAPAPAAFYRGGVAGEADSFVFLSARPDGSVRAVVDVGGRIFVIAPESADAPPASRVLSEVDTASFGNLVGGWSCANGELPKGDLVAETIGAELAKTRSSAVFDRGPAPKGAPYAVDVAVDTDWELLNVLGSQSALESYVADLYGAISAIYQRDVATFVQVSDLYVYTGGAGSDPWSAGSTSSALNEVQGYWLANRGGVDRTIVHFMSGKSMGGGIAYVGVLCSNSFGYGVSGGITGGYDASNPSVVWDIVVVAHEIGHNFNSPHTHCYNGIPAGAPPVDMCYGAQGGCYSGSPSLPAGGGSIMSYCHTLSPGLSNINLWLGRAGFYGNQSERVTDRISTYVQGLSFCLPEPIEMIFADGFETGNTSAWN